MIQDYSHYTVYTVAALRHFEPASGLRRSLSRV